LWGFAANFPIAQIARPLAILVLHQLRRAAVDVIASAASASASASASAG